MRKQIAAAAVVVALAGGGFVASRSRAPRAGSLVAVVTLPEDPRPGLWWHVIYDQGSMRRSAWFPPGTTGDVRLPADCWLHERSQPVVAGFWKDSPEGGVECCGEDTRVEAHVVDRFEGACE